MKELSNLGVSQCRYYTVYMITNRVTKERYIGQHITKKLDDDYMGSGKIIREQIAKYGKENFNKEILKVFDNFDDMNQEEIKLISEMKPEMNISKGGEGWHGVNEGMDKQTLIERNRKNHQKFLKKLEDKEFYEKFRQNCLGRPCPEKAREFIIEYNKTHEHKKGYKLSDDAKDKISRSLLEYNKRLNDLKVSKYKNNEKRCKFCNAIMPYNKRKNVYCSRECSAKGNHKIRNNAVLAQLAEQSPCKR